MRLLRHVTYSRYERGSGHVVFRHLVLSERRGTELGKASWGQMRSRRHNKRISRAILKRSPLAEEGDNVITLRSDNRTRLKHITNV